jgi:ankyrin repeat protein
MTQLHYAAQFGSDSEVQILVESGADFKAMDNDGKTAHTMQLKLDGIQKFEFAYKSLRTRVTKKTQNN